MSEVSFIGYNGGDDLNPKGASQHELNQLVQKRRLAQLNLNLPSTTPKEDSEDLSLELGDYSVSPWQYSSPAPVASPPVFSSPEGVRALFETDTTHPEGLLLGAYLTERSMGSSQELAVERAEAYVLGLEGNEEKPVFEVN